MRPSIERFDARVDAAVDTIRTPALDRLFYPISSAADHSLVWFAIGATRAVCSGDLRFAARFAAAMGLESALTNGPVKAIFNGQGEMISIKIDKSVVDPDDIEALEDLVIGCVRDGYTKSVELRNARLQEIMPNIPGMGGLGL